MPAKVFDFDDCLAKTVAKVIVDGQAISSMEYGAGDFTGKKLDFSQFEDPALIMKSTPLALMDHMRTCVSRREPVYVLTARSNAVRKAIHEFLMINGIKIPFKNIICVGLTDAEIASIKNVPNMSQAKVDVLKSLVERHVDVTFFDDSKKNIDMANTVQGVLGIWIMYKP